jgi:hypothetical protein
MVMMDNERMNRKTLFIAAPVVLVMAFSDKREDTEALLCM